ncbi:indolepyruvate ferredoxin oxidoreductase family protein [Hoyosella sp. YIM 151337]|uniref:indolepyruvate ferredoxin oxidoreductase family protein n=1 Tax=Hoyosella sp. YIM 151337 TaxID=2992742 RepID=UPI0022365120|nr:indolepyruvate ferredoxin oxidoreductase family protein [Hoyosella sp. YIM 151337]MCW4355775.1 indolepyruvate ferredoxin oxidoreductase family protein [Hoyosella sp. YIM 151337]
MTTSEAAHGADITTGGKRKTESFYLDERYEREDGVVYLTGIQALVRMLLDRARQDRRSGVKTATFVSGYEGSPLAGYDLELIRQRNLIGKLDIVHQPGLNEEYGATAVMGSQITRGVGTLTCDGVTGIWYGKAPGLDRSTDALRHANMIGTDPMGGAVALVGDDPGAKSSTIPSASEALMADMYMPVLYPGDSQDVVELGVHAQYMSRFTGLWTGLKVVTAVADGAGTVQVNRHMSAPLLGHSEPSKHQPTGMVLGKTLAALERSLHEVRLPRALEYARNNGLNKITRSGANDRIGVIASGKTYLDLQSAFRTLRITDADLARFGIRVLKLGMIYPLEPRIVETFADGLEEIIVIEEKHSFIESAVRDLLYGRVNAPRIIGRKAVDGSVLFPVTGELDLDTVAKGMAKALKPRGIEAVKAYYKRPRARTLSLPLAVRSPYFCSGCPHNSSTKVDDNTLVGGGIGCHAMVLLMDEKQVGNVTGATQMGGEGVQWIGMAPFLEEGHLVQNIGDGTFMHSGSLAVRAAVAAGVNITYKLLYNSAVAMTGGQHPVGEMTVEQITKILIDERVAKVVITSDNPKRINRKLLPKGVDVRPRDDLMDVQRELAQVPGVTVLIHDQECAAQKRRKRKRGKVATPTTKVMINERVCEGCGDCGEKSNCLSVQPIDTDFGRKTQINQSSCNLDYSCIKGDCPSFMTITPGEKQQHQMLPPLSLDDLPHPKYYSGRDEFDMRVMGIGGTGVVTVSQVLAMGSVIDGHAVRTLDQTGLAQKGGAVVSDIKMTDGPEELSAKVGEGSCDLYLGCDALVATDPQNLKVASPNKTIAVISTTKVATGQMVTDTSATYPADSSIHSAIDAATKQVHYLDAADLADRLFGDEQYANMILVGAALQTGVLPISESAIEQAIVLNGVAVEKNIQALRRGRQSVADPDALAAAMRQEPKKRAISSQARQLGALIGMPHPSEAIETRIDELIAYQDLKYAKKYVAFVAETYRAEKAVQPSSTVLTETVAMYLHKLMAYKDEYEVARLALLPEIREQIEGEFGKGAKVHYKLHPPMLRAMGMKNKMTFGQWFDPAFRSLKSMKKLRGTKLDPFGKAEVRKTERELIDEYIGAMRTVFAGLGAETLSTAVETAALPDMVRGYEDIKMRNVAKYRKALAQRLARQ